jgi:hypothetical protein
MENNKEEETRETLEYKAKEKCESVELGEKIMVREEKGERGER